MSTFEVVIFQSSIVAQLPGLLFALCHNCGHGYICGNNCLSHLVLAGYGGSQGHIQPPRVRPRHCALCLEYLSEIFATNKVFKYVISPYGVFILHGDQAISKWPLLKVLSTIVALTFFFLQLWPGLPKDLNFIVF